MGSRGRYLITDPDIIKEIMVKQFANFTNRSVSLIIYSSHFNGLNLCECNTLAILSIALIFRAF